jgi:hypothetical protein
MSDSVTEVVVPGGWQHRSLTWRRWSNFLGRLRPPGARALEFGCGLVGLAALAQGLAVTFSDYEPMAVRTALENARRNGFENVPGELIDWSSLPQARYPFLFGCDVLYNQQMHKPPVGFIESSLEEGGLCWIGGAGRFHAERFPCLVESPLAGGQSHHHWVGPRLGFADWARPASRSP